MTIVFEQDFDSWYTTSGADEMLNAAHAQDLERLWEVYGGKILEIGHQVLGQEAPRSDPTK